MTLEQQIHELQTELRCCELTRDERNEAESALAKAIEMKAKCDQQISNWALEIPT